MAEPDPRLSRRWLAAGAVGVAAVLVVAVIATRAPPPPPAARPAPPEPAAAAIPEPLPPVGRADLLQAAAAAADAYAGGAGAVKPDKDPLVGRRFEVRLPFGCSGPLPEGAVAADEPGQWRYDTRRKTIRISAQRQDWSDAPWVRALAAPTEVEAVEGFWLRRPWTSSESCPPTPAATPPAAPAAAPTPTTAPQTVGLAAFFEPGSSRVARRGARAYDYVQKTDEPPGPGPRPYRLVVSGRIRGYEDGRAVRCHAETPAQRPVCLIAVDFEKVALEDPRTGEVLGSWGT